MLNNQNKQETTNLALKITLLFVIAGVISVFWRINAGFSHTILEIANLFMVMSIFIVVWFTYKRNPPVNHTIGFGFLIIALFNAIHLYYYPRLPFAINRYFDISTRYESVEMFVGAILILIVARKMFNYDLNRWLGLVFTIIFATGAILVVYFFPYVIPPPCSEGGPTHQYRILKYITLVIFLIDIYSIRKEINNKSFLTYRYIFLALIFAILAEVSLIFLIVVNSYFGMLVMIFKTFYYYNLFVGIFKSAVIYPYDKLEETNNYMNEVLNYLSIGILTYNKENELNFANTKAEEILGYREEELTGISAKEMTARFNEEKKPNPLSNKILKIKNRFGSVVYIKREVQELKKNGYLHIIYDAKKEQELKNLQIQTQTVLDSIQNCVLIVDKNKRVIVCNKAFEQLSDMKSNDLLNLKIQDLNQIFKFNTSSIFDKALNGICLDTDETSIVSMKGIKKEAIIHVGPIYNIDHEVIGVMLVAIDITDLKEGQEKLKQQEKLAVIGEIAAGIVHEIRNPLTTIKGFTQLIAHNLLLEKNKEFINIIDQEVDNINLIVSDFLAFAKPQFPDLKRISLNNIVQSLYLLLETKSFIEGIEVQISLAKAEKEVIGDEFQLKQVILNLFKNAMEAMKTSKEPRLSIKTEFAGSQNKMLLTITDNGEGISPEYIAKIGTPFFTTKERGTGLGLSICYQIIKEHSGDIKIASEVGKGTDVTISLPTCE